MKRSNAYKPMTDAQKRKIRLLTRAANRRLERATGEHKEYIKSFIKQITGKEEKFSGKIAGFTRAQAAHRIKQLLRFLAARTTRIKDWKRYKRGTVTNANETLSKQGYHLTDAELAVIMRQVNMNNKPEFYRAVNLVEAAKMKAGDSWSGTEQEIYDTIYKRATEQEALKQALEARENAKRKV